MKLIRHLKDSAELACFQGRNNRETLEEAHKRIDQLEGLVSDLIDNIRDRWGDEPTREA